MPKYMPKFPEVKMRQVPEWLVGDTAFRSRSFDSEQEAIKAACEEALLNLTKDFGCTDHSERTDILDCLTHSDNIEAVFAIFNRLTETLP